MALISWRDEFETGIPSVDYEHRELIAMINTLYGRLVARDQPAVEEFLAALHDRIAAHFALEERVMRDRHYDGYAEHKADHERLLDEIRDLMEAARTAAFEGAPEPLAERLERWFSGHFGSHDVRLHRAVGDIERGE